MRRRHSFTVWQGPSLLDGKPIALLATRAGGAKHANKKTGGMLQTYIIRTDLSPVEAIQQGQDGSVCGTCLHSSKGNGGLGTCYVRVDTGPLQVYRAFRRGNYPLISLAESQNEARGQKVRLGTYGDPSAIPAIVWHTFLAGVAGQTGYTHDWKSERSAYLKAYVMASCDTLEEYQEATADGWRAFYVVPKGHPLHVEGAFLCPASEEGGKKLTCVECLACDGTGHGRRASVFIPVHGVAFKQARFSNLITIERRG